VSRTYIRDWRGRFARTGSVRVRKVHRPTVRKPKLRRPSFEPGIIQIGRTKDPLTWDQIKGTNAKRDGRILWRLKKDGDIQTEDEFVKKADQLHRLYRKAHPNDKNFATKNSICNAALRQEFDETGKVKPLPVPGHTEKAGPSTPAPKKEVGKTPGGMKLLEKYKPDPKKKYHIFGKNHPLDSDLDYKKAQDEGDKAEIAFLKGKVKYYRAQQRDKRSAHTAPYGAYIKDVEERIDELENPELHTDKEFLEGLYGKDDPKEQAAREKARQERIAKREAKRLGEITYKNQPAFEIRTRVRQLTKELGDSMDGFFKYAQKLEAKDPNFDMSPDYIKRRHDIRQRNDQIMGDLGRLEQKLNTMEPDTSESIKDAKDIADLIRIMQNRHPSVDVSTDFVTSIPAAKAEFMSKYKYDVTRV
jgi:hypothetical protein